MKGRRLSRYLIFTAFLLAALAFPAQADWQSCKSCGSDAYGQSICLLTGSIGPEGGIYCQAYRVCEGDTCYQVCWTWEACSWA